MTDTERTLHTIAFRAGPLLSAIMERTRRDASPHETARRDLERYYALLERATPRFSEAEASLIVDALNGTHLDAQSAHLIWAEVEEANSSWVAAASADALDVKWSVDARALVKRLRGLSIGEAVALADAVERYWLDPTRPDAQDRLRTVGLVR